MATKRARAKDIMTAIRDAAPDDATIARMLDGFALAYRPGEPGLTQEQKAGTFIRAVRSFVRDTVHAQEKRDAQEAAALTIQPPDMGND